MNAERRDGKTEYGFAEILTDHLFFFDRKTAERYRRIFFCADGSSEEPAEDGTCRTAACLTDSGWEALKTLYSGLFEKTDFRFDLPLWESFYRRGEKVLISGVTLEVVREYRKQLLIPAAEAVGPRPAEDTPVPWYDHPGIDRQPADFLGYEAEFYLWLRENEEKPGSAAVFLEKHLAPLTEGVMKRLSEELKKAETKGQGTDPAAEAVRYFASLSAYVLRRLLEERKEISDGTKTETAAAAVPAGSPDAALPPHFRRISAEDAETFLAEQVIASSGRGNCGGKCALRSHVAGGCITRLDAGAEDPRTKTVRTCVRGRGYRETFLSTDRIRYPMVRTGERGEGKFRRVSWEEALDLMAEKIRVITAKYGPGCRYVNYATGVTSPLRGNQLMKRLLSLTGGFLDSFGSYSSACLRYTAPYVFGPGEYSSSMASYHETELLILWGNNPVVTFYDDLWLDLLRDLKERKVPIIVIDPQFSDTAAVFADRWIPIRPGTDAALAAAIAWVLWTEDLADRHFMDTCCLGFDRAHMPAGAEEEETFRDYIFGVRDGVPKTPAWAAEITGIPETVISDLAVRYGKAKPAAVIMGLGPQRHANGEQIVRILMTLQCMTGNVGKRGGGTSQNSGIRPHADPKLPALPNPYGRVISCFLWAEAVRRGHEFTKEKERIRGGDTLDSDVKIMFNLAGNTLLNQHSDVNRTAELLRDPAKPELIVVSDLFMTSSARFADILLPGTSLFEEESIASPWAEGHFHLYGNRAVQPLFEGRAEYYWIRELAEKLGAADFSEGTRTQRAWNRILYGRMREKEKELPAFDRFTEDGGYAYSENADTVAFEEEIRDPAHHPFRTESGKIEIYSPALKRLADPVLIPAVPKYVPAFEGVGDPRKEKWPLQLIGWHTKRRTHSIHDNNPLMEKVEPHRLWMNPKDAAARGISDGDTAEVFNDRGKVRIRVLVSERIMEGVICLPQGAWYTPDLDGTDIRGNVNTLTIERPTPLAMANPQHSCLAEVRKYE